MSFRKIVTGVLVLCFAITSAIAQGPRAPKSPQQRAENQTRWMRKNLGITQEQENKVYDIILYYAREAEQTETEMPGPGKRMEKNQIRRGKDAELRDVLTANQYDQYQRHVADMKERRMERRAGY